MINGSRDFPPRNSSAPRPAEAAAHEPAVLTTWKEVARYMGKGVRTVQRWERDFGLPVRRPPGPRNRRAILALTSDLDAWVALRCSRTRHDLPAEPCDQLSRTLREQVRIAAELRIANRLLLNEIHIATEALKAKLNAMCPPSHANGRDLTKQPLSQFSTLPN
jgi:hypothetical protein